MKPSRTPQVRRTTAVVMLFAGGATGTAAVQARWQPAVPPLIVAGVAVAIRGRPRPHPAATHRSAA